MRSSLLLSVLISSLWFGACKRPGPTRHSLEARPVVSAAVQAWEVVLDSRVVGLVVKFEEQGGRRGFHSVRNADNQELGMVDEHGRAWHYRAHEEEPEWLVTGTVFEGVRAILGVGSQAEIYEVPLATLRREAR